MTDYWAEPTFDRPTDDAHEWRLLVAERRLEGEEQ